MIDCAAASERRWSKLICLVRLLGMVIPELERAQRALRLSGMITILQARAQQVAQHEMDFIEAFSWLVQDELDRRRSRLLERRFAVSGLPGRKVLIQNINQARELGEIGKYRAQLLSAELMILDDLFLRRPPSNAGDELADVLMSRCEKFSIMITSNRPIDDWSKLLRDVVVVAPLLDRLMHRGNLLKFEGRSWRLKEAAKRVAKRAANA
jgi:hypothetical protein